MANKRIITNPKFIVERDGNDYVLKFRDGNIYKPIEFNNAQLSGKRNTVIPNPNFSIIANNLYVNVNGINVKIGEVGDGYTLASNVGRSIVEPNLDIVLGSNGRVSVVTEIGGKNITINGGGLPPAPPNSILYTVVEGGHKPESTWITENCTKNVFDESTGKGYLVLNEGVTELVGWQDPETEIIHTVFSDITDGSDMNDNIKEIIIPNSITSIGFYAFAGCAGITEFIIQNSVTSLGDCAFYACSNLISVTIPDSVISIGGYVFAACASLTTVTIPNSVTSIGDYAFHNCSGLTEITIPNSVTSIGTRAFNLCTSLASVTCLATTPPNLGTVPFSNLATTICTVPEGSASAYGASDWANYFTTFTAIEEQQEE